MKTETELLAVMAGYCSQAERCIDDVRKKIKTAGLTEEAENRIIDRLLREKFIDERRFCRSFVNDKLKFNHWGRIKTGYELKKKHIKPETYSEAFDAIDENEYLSVLTGLLKSKKRSVKGRSAQEVFQKLYRFASSRGFEHPLIIKILKDLLGNMDYDDTTFE
ncbi:MAG: RecX family transcriptional regulator [Tannerella sp.]|jgi:regulatory protein|nr:RecX family transcriptional regulator [Tannerella sp.]